MQDEYFMKKAIFLSKKGAGFVSPNPLVGAVIVKDNKIIGKGWHKKYGENHAEVNAIYDAGIENCSGADIYVNLEPCNHFGKTPPCTHKIIEAKIKRVFIGITDPNPYASGGIKFLEENKIQVKTGILEEECKKVNEFFLKSILEKKPFIILKSAISLDGQIATSTNDSKWITNKKARIFAHKLRQAVDAILVGINTVNQDNPQLTVRLDRIATKNPIRIILDSNFSIKENVNLLNDNGKTIIVTKKLSEDSKIKKDKIQNNNIKVISIAQKNNLIDLKALTKTLFEMGIRSILIEGGSRVAYSFLHENLIDKAHFIYAPKILGGNDGIPLFSGEGVKKMKDSFSLKNPSFKKFDDNFMIDGYF